MEFNEVFCKSCGNKFVQSIHFRVYCSEECKRKAKNLYMNNHKKAKAPHYDKVCETCLKKYTTSSKRQRYCSKECSVAARIKRLKSYQKICIICGSKFVAKDIRANVCSEQCRKKKHVMNQTRYMKIKKESQKNSVLFTVENKFIYVRNILIENTGNGWIVISNKDGVIFNSKSDAGLSFLSSENAIDYALKIKSGSVDVEKACKKYLKNKELLEKRRAKVRKKLQMIRAKLAFPAYMTEELIMYTDNKKFEVIYQYLDEFIRKKLKLEDMQINKCKIINLLIRKDIDGLRRLLVKESFKKLYER